MDAEFLRLHVNEALLEALTATAIANPHDKIDYLGNYLVQYVNRNKLIRQREKDELDAEEIASNNESAELRMLVVGYYQRNEVEKTAENLENYITEVSETVANKQVAIDNFCQISAQYLNLPAVYIASKSTVDETDILYYLSAKSNNFHNNTQQFMVGKQLIKYDGEDNDDKPGRQGLSFNVFNLPEGQNEDGEDEEEVAEEENDDTKKETEGDNDDEENGNSRVKKIKVPFKLPSLVVENVMRNKDIKFFGIPKLGSLVIVPLSYKSTDHDTGCQIEIEEPPEDTEAEDGEAAEQEQNEEEGEEGKISVTKKEKLKPVIKYNPNPIKREYILAADTIGDYKPFRPRDVEWLEGVGAKLMATLERIDKQQFHRHIECLEQAQAYEAIVSKLITAAEEEEIKALEVIEKRFAPPAEETEEEEEDKEQEQEEKNDDDDEKGGEEEEGGEKVAEGKDGDDGEEKEGKANKQEEKNKDSTQAITKPAVPVVQEAVYIETEEPHELPHELLKPYRAARAVENVWKKQLVSDEMSSLLLKLPTYELPPPTVVLTLYQVLALFLDIPGSKYRDLFNNISWNVIVDQSMIVEIKNKIESYDCSQVITLSSTTVNTPAENSLESIKEQCEANALFESTTYSSVIASEGICALLKPLYIWLQKAIAAREAAML